MRKPIDLVTVMRYTVTVIKSKGANLMNVIAYLRVSTDGQVGEDKFGLDAQRVAIEDYCRRNEHTIVEWVTDAGESGAKFRPGFDRIVNSADVSNPPYQGVVVAKSDRVARDINIYFYYKARLLMKDIKLISVAEDFGQFGAFSGILEAFIVSMAQMERDRINDRTSAGRAVKSAKGGYSGGRTPYGYKAVNGRMVIDPQQAETIRFIFTSRDAGTPMYIIADELNKLGRVNRSGTAFSVSTIKTILENRKTYQGYYRYGKNAEWVKGEHEAIIPEAPALED